MIPFKVRALIALLDARDIALKALPFAASLVVLAACPNPPNPPTPDAGDGAAKLDAVQAPDADDPCALACANLAALGCQEAQPDCAGVCRHAQGTLTDLHPACLAGARTKEQARACKSVSCP